MIANTMDFEIDAVIAWVDGTDENHKKKLAQYVEEKSLLNNAEFLARYLQADEIEYCVKSIKKFAPYIRTIYIVTDEQVPSFLKNNLIETTYKNVKIIDHKVIFKGYEEYLPTFNCYPIETMVSKIPELTEHFIYFNDDMFLIQETKPTDFFTNDGYPIIRGKWKSFENSKFKDFLKKNGVKKKSITKISYKKAQENSAKILGLKKYIKVNHTPFPIRKSTLNSYLDSNTDVLINSLKYKFRDASHFMVQLHAAHLEVLNNTYELINDYRLAHFGSSEKSFFWIKSKTYFVKKNKSKLFLNIQSLDLYSKEKVSFILNWLDNLYR